MNVLADGCQVNVGQGCHLYVVIADETDLPRYVDAGAA